MLTEVHKLSFTDTKGHPNRLQENPKKDLSLTIHFNVGEFFKSYTGCYALQI